MKIQLLATVPTKTKQCNVQKVCQHVMIMISKPKPENKGNQIHTASHLQHTDLFDLLFDKRTAWLKVYARILIIHLDTHQQQHEI